MISFAGSCPSRVGLALLTELHHRILARLDYGIARPWPIGGVGSVAGNSCLRCARVVYVDSVEASSELITAKCVNPRAEASPQLSAG